jgi:hypothetical protein
MSEGFDQIVASASPEIRDLAYQAKALIQAVYPAVVEVPWVRQRIIGYGVGPKKMSEHFCYISIHKEHIDLGFYYGSELPDPENLLQGTGKLLRHVKISHSEQLENPALRRMLEFASSYRMPVKSQSDNA